MASSLLKLKSEFHNSMLESIEKGPMSGSLIWKGIKFKWINFGLKVITDEDFVVHVLNNLPKEYNVILDGLENHLKSYKDDALTIEVIHKKLNNWYEKIKNKNDEKRKKEKA